MTKIALLSDIHFGKYSRTNDFTVPGELMISHSHGEKSLKCELISKLKEEQVEYIIITGDLTSIGSPSEFIHCKSAIKEIANSVGVKSEKVIICLGNHDIDWNISKLSANYTNSTREIQNEATDNYLAVAGSVANHWLLEMDNYDEKGPAPYSGVIEFDGIVFFALNSGWLCSEKDAVKQGKLDSLQLEWISTKFSNYKKSKKWKILILHHHPFNYPYAKPSPDHSVLMEGPELKDLIGNYGINIVCHGHRHHPRVKNEMENGWLNPITFISSGSLSVNLEHRHEEIPNLFHIIELDHDKSFYLRSYKFSSLNGWVKVTDNNKHTPIDFEMFFQKPIQDSELITSIEDICRMSKGENQKELMAWKDLPNDLKSIRIEKLNSLLKEYCKREKVKCFGRYPDGEVVLINKNL
ncbi:metallophosphoesterase family protein [Labilibaculum euxinus]|uniref:Calcineurin-like phosphoesterase domain-containing protein n=1 Tax=Labilibaculum euxinus TaxID=2686357 RepID=A0A7M4D2Y0_9BACT|nr:metallophosphoesterase [Labilibaculum euxinus]MUP37009.1 hypothetical protein [Labilibaculum euxinus]MVB06214.1 hypothetical protein [Labilibaculum euxinus]